MCSPCQSRRELLRPQGTLLQASRETPLPGSLLARVKAILVLTRQDASEGSP